MTLVREHAERFDDALEAAGFEVLFDDRTGVSPGFKFKDADLLGMPLNVIVGEKHLNDGNVEIKIRNTGERQHRTRRRTSSRPARR
jgi:prolyl-tRNA synthetase